MAERLFARLPGHVRARDAAAGYPLRALLAIAEAELDTLHGDIAQLYDNWFIETCEEWVVPYIGELLGARRLNPAGGDGFSMRAYVANTLSYRRAKGTAAVAEQLARDVTGWPARVVEYWRHLVQAQHANHVRGDNLTADLRDADRAAQAGTPFDPWAHSIDVRPIARGLGRHNIPDVGIFLWRLMAAPIGFAFDDPADVQGGVVPRAVAAGDGRFHLHPAGVDAPLFNRPRGEPSIAHLATERDLPAPLRRLPLYRELAARRGGSDDPAGWFGIQPVLQVRLGGTTLPPTRIVVAHLGEQSGGGWRHPADSGDVMIDPVLGRLSLHPSDAGATVEVAYAIGAPAEIGAGPWDRRRAFAGWFDDFRAGASGEPWIAAVTRRTAEHTPDPASGGPCLASLADAVTLWNAQGNQAGARGVIAVLDSASYGDALPPVALAEGARLAIMAAGWPVAVEEGGARRRRVGDLVPAARRPYVGAGIAVAGSGADSMLVLDGLMTGAGITVAPGQLGALVVRQCTIGASPTGLTDGLTVAAGAIVPEITLIGSVVGAIALPEIAGRLRIDGGVVGEDRSADAGDGVLSTATAIDAAGGDVDLARCTVFGRIAARTLSMSGSIATGRVRAARRQEGCVRYSFLPLGSRTAPRFRCEPDLSLAAAAAAKRAALGDPEAQLTDAEAAAVGRAALPRFAATRFEQPAFPQLHGLCPDGVARGGEGAAEMGALASLGAPLRLANLREALGEYLRVGLEAGLFTVT